MSMRNPSRLDAGLIARKGEASPAEAPAQAVPPPPLAPTSGVTMDAPERMPRSIQGTIAVTVRLDPHRYERMKVYGARRRQTNQDILVEALDKFFAATPE